MHRSKLFKKIIIFLVIIVIFISLLYLSTVIDQPVKFADSGLEAAVREALKKQDGPINKSELLTISRLDASGRGITMLEGIEVMHRLVYLNLDHNQVQDLSPLRKLTLLRELSIQNNGISDLRKINFEALPKKIFSLNLRANRITNIEPLKNLTELTELNLRENDIVDLSPLSGLTTLAYLNIHSNPRIASIAPLANLNGLRTLIMRNVPIGDEISHLRNLTNLRRLNIRNCSVTSTAVLVELMAAGALQDDQDKGIEAVVDIRDNTFYPEEFYSNVLFHKYWKNISNRQPLTLTSYLSLEPPNFSRPGGFYNNEFSLTLESNDPNIMILYTLDGSEPDINNIEGGGEPYLVNYFYPDSWEKSQLIPRVNQTFIYDEPIPITDRSGEENDISNIITTYRDAPKIWWKKPTDDIYKGTVVRARTYDGEFYSKTVTYSYFIIDDKERFSLPVLSITTAPDNLFSYDTGIYVPGRSYFDGGGTEYEYKKGDFNYNQSGREWERPAHIEFFDQNGDRVISQGVGLRVHGGGSRSHALKSLRIYARSEYDNASIIDYEFFPSLPGATSLYKRVLLRGGGDIGDHIRDPIAHDIMSNSNVGIQRNQPVIHFINGEYWGIAQIRDRYDRYHLANQYNLDPDNIIILNAPYGELDSTRWLEAGVEEDIQLYNDLYNYAINNDLSQRKHYEHVKSMLCIDSYIDFNIMFIYLANVDWYGDRHFRFWRVRETYDQPYGDGKWRVLVWDFDRAFEGAKVTALNNAIHPDGEGNSYKFGGGPDSPKTALLRSLLENQEFKYQFINRFADHINTTFHPERVYNIIDYHYQSLEKELERHSQRWPGTSAAKPDRINSWKSFVRKRPDRQREQIVELFDLPGTATLTLNTDLSQGAIKINTIEINENTPGIEEPGSWSGVYFQGIPVTVTAIPKPGFRFVGWEETGQSEAELSLLLSGDLTLTANFEKE